MKNKILAIIAIFIISSSINAQTNMVQFSYNQYTYNSNQFRTIFRWNTKTGKSARYYYDDDSQWHKSSATIPDNPLGDKSTRIGEIMMNYNQYSDRDNQYRTVFVWNTKTGKSARYYYDDDNQWHKSSATIQ